MWLLHCLAALDLAGCAHERLPPPAPPAFPEVPKDVSFPFELPAPFEPEEPMVRGIYLEEGARGQPPKITIGQFRRVNDESEGALKFDMTALTKLESQLEGSSTAHDYVMKISNSRLGIAPDVYLRGIYRFDQAVLSVDYDDLRESPFSCKLDKSFNPSDFPHGCAECNMLRGGATPTAEGTQRTAFHLDCHYKEICVSDTKALYEQVLGYYERDSREEDRDLTQSTNQLHRVVDEIRTGFQDYSKNLAATTPAFIDTLVKSMKHADGLCDPTGKMLAAWDGRGYWSNNDIEILVFTQSTNPLYPAPKYYSMWTSDKGGEALKNAFQILYLVSQQRVRTTGK